MQCFAGGMALIAALEVSRDGDDVTLNSDVLHRAVDMQAQHVAKSLMQWLVRPQEDMKEAAAALIREWSLMLACGRGLLVQARRQDDADAHAVCAVLFPDKSRWGAEGLYLIQKSSSPAVDALANLVLYVVTVRSAPCWERASGVGHTPHDSAEEAARFAALQASCSPLQHAVMTLVGRAPRSAASDAPQSAAVHADELELWYAERCHDMLLRHRRALVQAVAVHNHEDTHKLVREVYAALTLFAFAVETEAAGLDYHRAQAVVLHDLRDRLHACRARLREDVGDTGAVDLGVQLACVWRLGDAVVAVAELLEAARTHSTRQTQLRSANSDGAEGVGGVSALAWVMKSYSALLGGSGDDDDDDDDKDEDEDGDTASSVQTVQAP